MEKLRIQSHRSFEEVPEVLDDALDLEFKPGLMKQVRAFLFGEAADRLIITKPVLAEGDSLARLDATLRLLNPAATISAADRTGTLIN